MNPETLTRRESCGPGLTEPAPGAFRRFLAEPVILRGRRVENRLFLAPMAGLGHVAFRELVDGFGGCGLMFTGMCSARAVPQENPRVSPVFRWRGEELGRLVCQIFGPDPQSMVPAARRIEKEGFFGVDLNFGCSVAAICKKGCGAALLKTPSLAADIVARVREAVSIPVFVKFRTGWQDSPGPAADMARRFEDAGADALVFHPRVAPDRRSRPPRWDHITRVREAVSIPVFGNGNLFEPSDGMRMLTLTGCHGLSIGRMAVAAPWLFAQWTRGWVPPRDVHLQTAIRFTELLEGHYGPGSGLRLFRKFVPYFSANFRFGHEISRSLLRPETLEGVREAALEIFSSPRETLSRPNINLFV
jgi:nifR3 family TIM-barrel protein